MEPFKSMRAITTWLANNNNKILKWWHFMNASKSSPYLQCFSNGPHKMMAGLGPFMLWNMWNGAIWFSLNTETGPSGFNANYIGIFRQKYEGKFFLLSIIVCLKSEKTSLESYNKMGLSGLLVHNGNPPSLFLLLHNDSS